jgi:hypothetical protein
MITKVLKSFFLNFFKNLLFSLLTKEKRDNSENIRMKIEMEMLSDLKKAPKKLERLNING